MRFPAASLRMTGIITFQDFPEGFGRIIRIEGLSVVLREYHVMVLPVRTDGKAVFLLGDPVTMQQLHTYRRENDSTIR